MKETKMQFVQVPSSLITVLSPMAYQILSYAIHRQGLVRLGKLKEWKLSRTDVRNVFGKFRGYGDNATRESFRELRSLKLITPKPDHDVLNTAELERWMMTTEGVLESNRVLESNTPNPEPLLESNRVPLLDSNTLLKSQGKEDKNINNMDQNSTRLSTEIDSGTIRKVSGNQSAEPKAVSPSAQIQGSTFEEVWDQIPTFTSSSAEGSVDEFKEMELAYSASMASSCPVPGYAGTAQERLSTPAHPDSLATGEKVAVEPYTLKEGHPNRTLLQGAITRIHERLADGEKFTFRSLLQRHPGNLNGLLIGEYEEKAKGLSKGAK